jgi:hypothetical protein
MELAVPFKPDAMKVIGGSVNGVSGKETKTVLFGANKLLVFKLLVGSTTAAYTDASCAPKIKARINNI